MDMGYEHELRERAYAIWLAAGMIDGEAESHWLHAEAAMHAEANAARSARPRAASVATDGPVETRSTKAVARTKADAATKKKPVPSKAARPVARSAKIGGKGLSAAAAAAPAGA